MSENKSHIKTIDFIKKMAVFNDFSWKDSVRKLDENSNNQNNNNQVEFKRINILYGRNYSGKTTLSRIFRALETGVIADNYTGAQFQLCVGPPQSRSADEVKITQIPLEDHGLTVRVFNQDFIKENLYFIFDEDKPIKSFAILGEENNKIEQQIQVYQRELGSETDTDSLMGQEQIADHKLKDANDLYTCKKTELDKILKEKATGRERGIKYNSDFNQPNYNITSLRDDIRVTQQTDCQLKVEKIEEYKKLLKEEKKVPIPAFSRATLQYHAIADQAKTLIEKKIQPSAPIQDLLNDAALSEWVRTGREHHNLGQSNPRSECAFCGNPLPKDLQNKLDQHFNQESDNLRNALKGMISKIDHEEDQLKNRLSIDPQKFYSRFTEQVQTNNEQLVVLKKRYEASLDSVKNQLEKRQGDIFTAFNFQQADSFEQAFKTIEQEISHLITESNALSNSLSEEQQDARERLRLYEVNNFRLDKEYDKKEAALEQLIADQEAAKNEKKCAEDAVERKNNEIKELEKQRHDEKAGAERVNQYLKRFFDHPTLALEAVETQNEGGFSQYQFQIRRNASPARNLSEGECSLIAFCYFMAKLEDDMTHNKQPIIWIDDPISSLDSNHIFFIYGLIQQQIVDCKQFSQLFVSTHNLDFLKYLKNLHKKAQYFQINRINEQTSKLSLMSPHLRENGTEFQFLFHKIYQCAYPNDQEKSDTDRYYNFGNNARKFLEVYLYYKYLNLNNNRGMKDFFGDDFRRIERIINASSHAKGAMERAMQPIDIPEMQGIADCICKKIKERDGEQYESLCASIGVNLESDNNNASGV